MNALLKRLRGMADEELIRISDAIDAELEARQERTLEFEDSAHWRAVQRRDSYRRRTGSMVVPVRTSWDNRAA